MIDTVFLFELMKMFSNWIAVMVVQPYEYTEICTFAHFNLMYFMLYALHLGWGAWRVWKAEKWPPKRYLCQVPGHCECYFTWKKGLCRCD